MSIFTYPTLLSATIANGAALSGPVDLDDKSLVAIVMPGAWTAAPLTFQCSVDNGATWNNVFDATGSEVSISAATGTHILIEPAKFVGAKLIRLRSGTSAAPVNQAAARTITLVTRQVD
ncbi:hypothetical protein [Roseomonas chloroacetimidivorans]|uniref:hypothetical protein n=1 Tax=Roseomonas chloroacetimidivorans TaxID=1766656 RepID=UPI003C76399F